MTDFLKMIVVIAFTVLACTLPVWSNMSHDLWAMVMLILPALLLVGPLLGKLFDWMDKGAN